MKERQLSNFQIEKVVPIVAGTLKNHVGSSNAISSHEIIYYLEDVHRIILKPADFRAVIHYIRVNKIVDNVLAGGTGYYVAAKLSEKKTYLKNLGKRIDSITEVYDALQDSKEVVKSKNE